MFRYPPPAPPSPTNINIIHHHHPDGQEQLAVDVLEDADIYTGHLHVERQNHASGEEFEEFAPQPKLDQNPYGNGGGKSQDSNSAIGIEKPGNSSTSSGQGTTNHMPAAGGRHRRQLPQRPTKPLRLHVHVLTRSTDQQTNIDIQFMTTSHPRYTVFQLKKKIEAQFKSLFPESPPLAVRALADSSQYLLPDPLVVEDVFAQDSQVNVVAEGTPFAGVGVAAVAAQKWDPARTCTQTHGWISHASAYLENASNNKAVLNKDGAHVTLPLLCDLITSAIDNVRKEAGHAMWRFSAFADFAILGPRLSDAALRNVCSVARFSDREDQETIKGCGVFLYNACMDDTLGKRIALARGREASMAISAHTNSADVREMATETLMVLDRHAQSMQLKDDEAKQMAATVVHRKPDGSLAISEDQKKERKKQAQMFVSGEGSQWNQMVSTIRTLLGSDREDSHIYIAELVNRAIPQAGFLTHLQQNADSFALLARVVAATDAGGKASESVARCLSELCASEAGRKFLMTRAAFALCSQLCMSRDPSVRTHAVAVMREVCADKSLPLVPPEWLLALARSPVVEAQRAATKGLSLIAARDADNILHHHISVLVALASADDPFVQRFSAEALGMLAMKELNKLAIVKAGGMDVFASFLSIDAEIELQRIGAKAMANLSSTDKSTRMAVIQYVQKNVPDWQQFNDHIVNVYLEMMFTA
jgi:hypothetical protein